MREGKAKVLTDSEINRLFKIISVERHSNRNHAIFMMSLALGLRVGEIASLRVDDVLGSDDELRDHFQIKKANSKTNRNREVYLTNNRVRKSLSRYLEERKHKEGVAFHPNSYLFRSQKGNGFTGNSLQMMMKRMFKKAGLPDTVSSHSGRRGFATKLISQQGIDIKSVSVLMGHSNISQTAQYVETNPDLLKKVVAGAF